MQNVFVAVAAVVVAVAGCGGSAGQGAVSLDDYPAEFRDALCQYLVRCGAAESSETCRTGNLGFRQQLISADQRAAIAAGKAAFHGDKAAACVDALAATSCDRSSQSGRLVFGPPCDEVITGEVSGGGACARDFECASARCALPSDCSSVCCQGTCMGDAPPPAAKLGELCETVACAASLHCEGSPPRCASLRARNAECDSGLQCEVGLDCLDSNVCGELPGPGELCTSRCRDLGLRCTGRTCVALATAGEVCSTIDDCVALHACDATRHCAPGLPLGAACMDGALCAGDGAFCDTPRTSGGAGTCALPKPDGQLCSRDTDCQSAYCDPVPGQCAPAKVCT